MLDNLTAKISNVLNKFAGKKKINDFDIKLLLKDFRKILLEADVSWTVTKCLIENLRTKLTNVDLVNGVSSYDYFIKIVVDEFLNIFKFSKVEDYNKLYNNFGISIVLFVGLNGVGKTTNLIKLANLLKQDKNKKVLVVTCDVYRSAAKEQLSFLANKASVDCFINFSLTDSPLEILNKAIIYTRAQKYDFLLVDSAGRSHVDDKMMYELKNIISFIKPDYTFLTVDSIVGQSGIKSALAFCDSLNISGFFLTKMDGDSKGGVLLSLSFLTKKAIYFIGTGEKITDITFFYPDRIVSRILGFGDLTSLLEDINKKINLKDEKVILDENSFECFTFDDFKKQIKYMLDLGGMNNLLDKMPNNYNIDKSLVTKFDDKFFLKIIAIINSMTLKERIYPSLLNGSRKRRISLGAGVSIIDVNKVIKYYDKMKKLFSKAGDSKSLINLIKKK